MTQEQKAKAYDEALKRVKEVYQRGYYISDDLEKIFPELKESEGEKIRKELIDFIKRRDRSGCDYDYDQWIAWLEKQHTDPHNGVCFYCYGHRWDMCARDNGIEIVMDGKPVRQFSYKDCEQTFGGMSALEAINEVY